MTSIPTPAEEADTALRAVLESQWRGEPAVVLRSPPGAGKTGVAQRVALQSAAMLGQRCMVATQTNEQAFDLTRRLAANAGGGPVYFLAKQGLSRIAEGRQRLAVVIPFSD